MPEECTGQWVNRDLDKTSGDGEKKVLPPSSTVSAWRGHIQRSRKQEDGFRPQWQMTAVAWKF